MFAPPRYIRSGSFARAEITADAAADGLTFAAALFPTLRLEREQRLWRACTGSDHVTATYWTADANGGPRLPSLFLPAHDREHELPVEFICGSYMPQGSEGLADASTSEFAWLETQGADGYEELGLDIEDFDLIYAFPWPGEEEFVHVLFDRYAAEGALLLTFNGVEDLRFQRKTGRRR